MKKISLIATLFICFLTQSALSLEVEGIQVPDVEVIGEEKLSLHGTGIRKATIFNIKVYLMSFYYPVKLTSEDELLLKPKKFIIKLKFLRDVSKEKLIDSFSSGFAKNSVDLGAYSSSWKVLQQGLDNLNKGDELIFTYGGEKLVVKCKSSEVTIDQIEFIPQLLKLWFGTPPNEDLKKGLLSR